MSPPTLDYTQITITIRFAGEMAQRSCTVKIGAEEARCIRPLPPDRELEWCPESRQKASKMMMDRRHLADILAHHFVDIFQSNDTVNGYLPERNSENKDRPH